jgi:DNA-binding CsgD family transcriptional regulator/sugar-specific transcriptional regulator TrmB
MSQSGSRLSAIGVDPLHERVYRYLVREGRSRAPGDVAVQLGLSMRVATSVLRKLESQALIIKVDSRPPGYVVSPPELALESLVARRGEELAQVRLLAKELQSTFHRAVESSSAYDLVEVIVGRDQLMRYYLHLVQGARVQFDTLTKPPYVSGEDTTDNILHAEAAGVRRGVRFRSVYESDALNEALTLDVAEQSIALGEEARAISGVLPMKLALFDQRIGFAPLKADDPNVGALVVHPSPLLEALVALFEGIWARAVPLHSARDSATNWPAELDERARQVLLLMSAGLKDESIARAMGMSRRTVQKYVTTTMTILGARTRFQAALLARERGWVGGSPSGPASAG